MIPVRSMSRSTLLAVTLLGTSLLFLGGCRGGGSYAPQAESARNPLEAQRLTLKAADLLDQEKSTLNENRFDERRFDEAESLLRQALSADLYHGPAHNDLGVVYLKKGKLYEAAGEFEWARKLLPGHPDPRMNLALTLERAGRYDDAARTYASALEVYPGHIPTLQAITRLQLKHGRKDDHTAERLATIAVEGDSPQWREWAQQHLSRTP